MSEDLTKKLEMYKEALIKTKTENQRLLDILEIIADSRIDGPKLNWWAKQAIDGKSKEELTI